MASSMPRDPTSSSYRLGSLAAVCFQSTVLAIVLHVSQASLQPGQRPYKPSSAVLLTELGKLVLSIALAFRDVWKERATLRAPRHVLPSPELYARANEVYQKEGLYADDPYDAPVVTLDGLKEGPVISRNTLRRRSSQAFGPGTPDVLAFNSRDNPRKKQFPSLSSLKAFQWPSPSLSPIVSEKGSPDLTSTSPEIVQRLNDPTLWIRRRRLSLRAMLWEDVFDSDWYMMAVPAVLFAVQNNLIYIAARNLSFPVFHITFQAKTLVTALCAVVMLGRRLSTAQWTSLLVLAAGVATMQIGAAYARSVDPHPHVALPEGGSMEHATGLAAVLVSCFCSAVAATYFEVVLKRPPVVPAVQEYLLVAPPDIKPTSLWVRNIQLSLFSSVLGIGLVTLQRNHDLYMGEGGLSLDFRGLADPLEHWYDPVVVAAQDFFDGFHPIIWAVIGLQIVGGLLIAMAIKYADNVAKGFALSISMVFTFLLSVILFNFQLSASSILGGSAVVAATLIYETDGQILGHPFSSKRRSTGEGKVALRRWHYFLLVVLATTLGVAMFPSRHVSLTDAAWDLITAPELSKKLGQTSSLPTVAIADMSVINARLTRAASACGWGIKPDRQSTRAPFGKEQNTVFDSPYQVTKTNQYALDDILSTRLQDYSNLVPVLSHPAPDFIFLPLLSQIYSNPSDCNAPDLVEGIRRTTNYIRAFANSVEGTSYPRIVLPLATPRGNFEKVLLTPEIMEELKDTVIIVSTETAPRAYAEKLKYLIDLPYPTSFHLSTTLQGVTPDIGDYYLERNRPYLLYYAAANSHRRGLPSSDLFNGFALRGALRKEITSYLSQAPEEQTSKILFDDITNAVDGQQNLTDFYDHMISSTFCAMPAGDSPTRRALYEAIQLGCIPVIFRERSYGRLFPSSPEINDMSKYSVFVEETELVNGIGDKLIKRLEQITPREIHRMQRHLRSIASKLQWSIPDEEAFFETSRRHDDEKLDGSPAFNRTVSLARQANEEPVVDAFAMLLKELNSIKTGKWVPGVARDRRKGVQPFGRSRPI